MSMASETGYTLGKGKLMFKPDGETNYIDLGNAPAFGITLATDKLEHVSSRAGLSLKDKELISKMTMTGSFTLDEPIVENLKMFVMASAAAETTQVAANLALITNVVIPAADGLGRWYELYSGAAGTSSTDAAAVAALENRGTATLAITGAANHATASHVVKILIVTTGATGTFRYSIDSGAWTSGTRTLTASAYTMLNATDSAEVEDLILTFTDAANAVIGDIFTFNIAYTAAQTRVYNIDTAGLPSASVTVTNTDDNVTYVEGIEGVGNYQVDRAAGLLYINTDQSTPTAAISLGQTLHVSVKKLGGSKSTMLGATMQTLKGYLYFIGNPPEGEIVDVKGYCSLTPSGDLGLVSTDWIQMQFAAEFLLAPGAASTAGLITLETRGHTA